MLRSKLSSQRPRVTKMSRENKENEVKELSFKVAKLEYELKNVKLTKQAIIDGLRKQLATKDQALTSFAEMKQNQKSLETQIQLLSRLQNSQAKKIMKDAIEKHEVPTQCSDDIQELKTNLALTKKDLANQLGRMQKLRAECLTHKEELGCLKRWQQEQEEKKDDKGTTEKPHHGKCQCSELLLLVKKQTKLIDVLLQQRQHIEAASLLDITVSAFMKEVNC